ncbi:MAG: hypothetical protein JJU34_00075 [Lunatimonas sp.]|uniref:hypothetical protein n=1 Tax=Lunatimonas sp. TaxID=2060141 RepID=UPI00263A5F18|nr:hypothetical protein [Lunatimonas sp.]MCC5935651.1 hypothetical protein [Lunatimonas sp.]
MHKLLTPFQIRVDPMSKLLLINFEKDPDKTYIGFEPQVFDDEVNGRGHLVIGWRRDGKVDVFHQVSLSPNPAKFDIAGGGISTLRATAFQQADFIISDRGVQIDYLFTDLEGREICLRIAESHPKARKPFDLLAPMGLAAEKPSALPLVYLFDFYFVRRKYTDFHVSINGREHVPDLLPFPLDCVSMLFARYSPRPQVVMINPAFSGTLSLLDINQTARKSSSKDETFVLAETPGGLGIKTIKHKHSPLPLEMQFDPPFPNLMGYLEEVSTEGRFRICSKASAGEVGGIYTIKKERNKFNLVLEPSLGWIPKPDRWTLRLLFALAKPFRQWPKSYRWEAEVIETDGEFFMDSCWIRI